MPKQYSFDDIRKYPAENTMYSYTVKFRKAGIEKITSPRLLSRQEIRDMYSNRDIEFIEGIKFKEDGN